MEETIISVGLNMNEETDFSTKTCIPCQGGVPALNEEEIGGFISKLILDGK